jgi:hypothetical protein
MSELETKVAEQLAKMNSEDSDYDSTSDEPDEDVNSSTDDGQTESADDESNDSSSGETGDTNDATDDSNSDDGDSTEATGDDGETEVPNAYLRAAVHQGWKEEEVVELWKEDPEKAERMLKANLTATNNLSTLWSQLGQQQMGVQTPPAVPVATPDNLAPKANTNYTGLDIDKLKGQYDDDGLIDDVVKPLNDLLIKMNTKLESVETKQTQVSQSNSDKQKITDKEKSDAINLQITGFFDSLESKELKTFYGTGSDWSKFEGGQAENRMKLLTQADQIKTGAAYQGKEITNEAAMNLANLILSSHLAEQKIISGIKNSLTKRESSMSLKPSGSRASSVSDSKKDKSEKGLIKTIGSFMKQRGIKQY